MKNHYIKLFAAAYCLFSAGCRSETAGPGNTFHLSVEHVITNSELTVSLLKVHLETPVPHDAYIHLDSEQIHGGEVLLGSPPGEAARDGQIAFSAARLAQEGEHSTRIQTYMRAESFGNSVTAGPTLNPVPAGTTLDAYFSISATNGDYKLDTPMWIGQLDGKPITLIVGQSVK